MNFSKFSEITGRDIDMAQWFSQYWYLVILFFAVLGFTVFGVYKASGAYKRHNKLYRREEEKIKRLVLLKERFSPLTVEAIDTADECDLLEGVALSFQLTLQKQQDMTAAFNLLPVQARYIYTLDIFVSEGAVVSEFYRNNGKELKQLIVPAMKAIGEDALANICAELYDMFDEDSEVSVDREKIAEVDAKFNEAFDLEKLKKNAARYIKGEKGKLV